MKQISMIFNSDMVKALLDGRKTVSRHSIRPLDDWELACENHQ